MKRRTLLTAAGIVLLAGCSSGSNGEERDTSSDDTNDSGGDVSEGGSTEEEVVDGFRATLEERGFGGVAVERVGDALELGYDATGPGEDDVAAEIERIADGYTTTVEEGLSTTHLDATAYGPDGDVVDYFGIESEWVEAYLSDGLEWSELLTRIAETFVSEETDAEDDETDAEGGETDAEDGAEGGGGSDDGESEETGSEGDTEDGEGGG